MASLDDCRAALDELNQRLSAVDKQHRESKIPDRTLSLHLLDHDVMFRGTLHKGELINITEGEPEGPKSDIRLTMSSDDLVAMTNRELSFAQFLRENDLALRADLLRPLAHWITPKIEKRRYDTRFFLAELLLAECDAAVRDFNVCMAIDDGQVPPRFFNGSDEVFGEMARGLDDSE